MEPGLRTYVLKRVGFAVLMLVGVSIILFTIMRLAPGGPEAVLIGGEFSQDAAAQIRQRLGLDRPLALQYLGWAGAALRGDLGRSFKTGDPVSTLILDRLAPTVQLTFGALALALVVAVPARLGEVGQAAEPVQVLGLEEELAVLAAQPLVGADLVPDGMETGITELCGSGVDSKHKRLRGERRPTGRSEFYGRPSNRVKLLNAFGYLMAPTVKPAMKRSRKKL